MHKCQSGNNLLGPYKVKKPFLSAQEVNCKPFQWKRGRDRGRSTL